MENLEEMDKFLHMWDLYELSQDIWDQNSSIANNKLEETIETLPTDQMGLLLNFTIALEKKQYQCFTNTFCYNIKGSYDLRLIIWSRYHTDTTTRQESTKIDNHISIFLVNIDVKVFN